METLIAQAGVFGVGVWLLVKTLRRAFDPDTKAPGYVWMIASMAIGVAFSHVIRLDVTAIPSDAPAWLVRTVVGLLAGPVAAVMHRGDTLAKARTHRNGP